MTVADSIKPTLISFITAWLMWLVYSNLSKVLFAKYNVKGLSELVAHA